MGGHDYLVYAVYRLIKAGVNAGRRALAPKPCSHGMRGFCLACEVERQQRLREEFARSPEGMEPAKQKKWRDIYDKYSSLDEESRERL